MTTGIKNYRVYFNKGDFIVPRQAESQEACYQVVLNELQNGDPYLTYNDEEDNVFSAIKKDTIHTIVVMEDS